ncbi:MAG: hypothetical protein FRX49_07747 [Trebouxia sp. A1-2]|nr:MAG: hypothetical protein FRX49_07747 [Trebouxia sp. A1-2]
MTHSGHLRPGTHQGASGQIEGGGGGQAFALELQPLGLSPKRLQAVAWGALDGKQSVLTAWAQAYTRGEDIAPQQCGLSKTVSAKNLAGEDWQPHLSKLAVEIAQAESGATDNLCLKSLQMAHNQPASQWRH